MAHKEVFSGVVTNALKMQDDDQAINFACTQLECMYQFTNSAEVRSMCALAVDKFYSNRRFRGNDHVLRIFQVLARISKSMGAVGIYSRVEDDGYFRSSVKFHIHWAEAEAANKNKKKFKEIWGLARERCSNRNGIDCAFREIASMEFPEVTCWFEDEDAEKTLNMFAPTSKGRRRSVALIERAAIPQSATKTTNSKKIHFMSKGNGLRPCFIDRESDSYCGISMEEWRFAKSEDLADMDITTMQPIEEEMEEEEMEVEKVEKKREIIEEKEDEEYGDKKKMRVYSPKRQPLAPKQEVKESPLASHTSFTSNYYSQALNAFSTTMKVADEEREVRSPTERDATYNVDRTASSSIVTSSTTQSASKESFEIFVDGVDGEEEKEPASPIPPPPPVSLVPPPIPARSRGLSARPVPMPMEEIEAELENPFDDNEPTVAGFNRGKPGKFLTSTPAVRGFDKEEEPNFWMESDGGGIDSLDLSAIDKGEEEKKGVTMNAAAGSGFARKRKSFGGGVVGDKARSSIGPKGGQPPPEKEIEEALLQMNIGEEKKMNPWDREVRKRIMSVCSTPVNQHDLPGSIKQPREHQKMELGGEVYSLEKMIGEGGFAKVFLCTNEKKEMLAMKYETPSCEWEVYILEALRKRIRSSRVMDSLMQVTDAFIYQNCSLILSEFIPMGTLLQATNEGKDPHWSLGVFLGMQMAKVLRDVHEANIVHGDAKPDNWMIIEKIDENAEINELLESRMIRLIDWGRAIDMKALGGKELYGRAGTEQFDCIEMMEGRPWTYHPDFYAFCATIYVFHMNEYMNVANITGRYAPVKMFKRRVKTLPLWSEIFDECFNIPSSSSLPSWSLIHDKLKVYFVENFDKPAWKEAVRKFNASLVQRKV